MVAVANLARIGEALLGALLVVAAMRSAVRTLVLPRAAADRLAVSTFVLTRRLFALRVKRAATYPVQDRIMALYAPTALVVLPAVWLLVVAAGYTLLYHATGVGYAADSVRGDVATAFAMSGSSLLTLGFVPTETMLHTGLAFSEAFIGLLLIALLIAYLPTMYGAFSRREVVVNLLAVRADTPPSAVEMLLRARRIGDRGQLRASWGRWERWFAELEESHLSLAALVFFRSPHPKHSWITAAGAMLDAAALVDSTLDVPRTPEPQLCLRAGYLALRNIARFFTDEIPRDPHWPAQSIAVTREEYDAACARLEAGGWRLKADRDQAWRDFAGWRVNYDLALRTLAVLAVAPEAPWSSDRPPEGLTVFTVPRAPWRRGRA